MRGHTHPPEELMRFMEQLEQEMKEETAAVRRRVQVVRERVEENQRAPEHFLKMEGEMISVV